jgi:ABC-type Fe3+-citrate transport system substrate-binding protein
MSEEINKPEQPFAHLVRALQEGEALRLSQCIEQIDNRLVNCRKSLEEYRRLRVALRVINSQLSRLGAEPLSVSDDRVSHDFIEMIRSRIDHFKSSGKL